MKQNKLKKLVSLNQDRYKEITVNEALGRYHHWCKNLSNPYSDNKPTPHKTFIKWLETEI